MFSVLVLTKNEEHCVANCFESLKGCDDIVVYDSYSTDQTSHIAREYGVRLVRRPGQDLKKPFGGDEGKHRTWGLHNISFKYSWLFVIDADERLSPAAISELQSISEVSSPRFVGYRIRRRDFFCGRELRYVQVSPWYIRFFKPEFVHYERLVNCLTVVDGAVSNLHYPLDHYPFSKGLSHWFDRHNSYSSFEAQQIIDNRSCKAALSIRAVFFESDFNLRRYHQKELFYRLPARPLIKFFLLYILKRGFLDGGPGFTYSILQSIYEYMIILKVRELEESRLYDVPL